ncbi:hypothetical protein [Brevundimonas aurifodinae]|uniref:Uncharacterized protein n=1 Tax=Brevundimonas aurifodinae TaxID=1508312 RepID=A0ABV1NL66_9CAUL
MQCYAALAHSLCLHGFRIAEALLRKDITNCRFEPNSVMATGFPRARALPLAANATDSGSGNSLKELFIASQGVSAKSAKTAPLTPPFDENGSNKEHLLAAKRR